MADSIWVSILSGGIAGALASVGVAYLKEQWQRGRDQSKAVEALHAKIEEIPQLVRAKQSAMDPDPTVDAIAQIGYYEAKERAERRTAEELDRALSAMVNAGRRLGGPHVQATIDVRIAARLAASAEDGPERQSRNHALDQCCERACTVGLGVAR